MIEVDAQRDGKGEVIIPVARYRGIVGLGDRLSNIVTHAPFSGLNPRLAPSVTLSVLDFVAVLIKPAGPIGPSAFVALTQYVAWFHIEGVGRPLHANRCHTLPVTARKFLEVVADLIDRLIFLVLALGRFSIAH